MIGRYKLIEKLGEGGFGSVWMADQSEPVKRRVALKIIKLGMDTRHVVARFEAERQVLALMDHPNIAKVLDAGATQSGRPYFVMELVKGIKIKQYCDQNKVALAERLSLFLQLCNAVQHAHQKGIIHRDIKPSNVLVTTQDGAPVPKVIDFGIAKATEQPLTDRTLFTAYEQFLGTPAYMSPEQAERSGLDIDTRSDIYSLGVLLYELLTGRTPFNGKTLMEHGVEGARRLICEANPPRPSTRLSTLAEDELSAVAQRRSVEARKLPKLLHGDLDWIVMKCLEKDRTRRYATVNVLTLDIQRYLNHETVLARPPSQAYRFSKMMRRNKLAFAAAAAVFVALTVGLGFASWSLIGERAARSEASIRRMEAETERRLAEEQRRLAENQRATAELRLYVADMNLGFQALEKGNFSRVRQLLAAHATHQPDPRSFEWRYLWTHTRGQHQREFRGHEDVIRQIQWSPDERSIASRSLDDVVKLWSLADGNPTLTLTNIYRLGGYTPDGTQLILGTTNAVVSWSFQKGELKTLFRAPTTLLSLLSDGQTIATSQTNFTVRLWDASSGENKMELSGDGGWLISDQQIPTVAVTRSGRRLALGYRQADDSWAIAEIAIMDLETRREIVRFPEHRRIFVSAHGK